MDPTGRRRSTRVVGRFLAGVTGGRAPAPLVVLFLLNAVDELDRSAFAVLVPEIRDAFGLDTQGILNVIGIVTLLALAAQVVVGYYADRFPRVRIATAGAGVWAVACFATGLAPAIGWVVAARCLTAAGRAVNDPTHNSLLADYYPPETRTKVYGVHRAANGFGQIAGPLLGGGLAYLFGWRAPFLLFALPTLLVIVLAVAYLREPLRGAHERRAAGGDEEAAAREEPPPSLVEAWRLCHRVRTLRRIWRALPFLAVAVVGLNNLTSLLYEEAFRLDEFERGVVAAVAEPFQLVGLAVGIPIAARLARRDPAGVLRFLAVIGLIVAAALIVFSQAHTLGLAVAAHVAATSALGMLLPAAYATISLALPPRARSIGFAIGALYVIPGVLIFFALGTVAETYGIRAALAALAPIFVVGGLIVASAGRFLAADIERVRAESLAGITAA